MEAETTIAQGLHATDDSADYDAACKRVLSEKSILARIMKACLDEYKDCDVNEIAGKYIEGNPQVSAVPVWICMHPPKSRENTITRYRVVEEHLVGKATEPVKNYDLLEQQ